MLGRCVRKEDKEDKMKIQTTFPTVYSTPEKQFFHCQLQHAIQIFIKIFDLRVTLQWIGRYYKCDYNVNQLSFIFIPTAGSTLYTTKACRNIDFPMFDQQQRASKLLENIFLYQHTFEHKISTTWLSVHKTLYFVIFPNLTLIIFPSKLFQFMIIVYSNYW